MIITLDNMILFIIFCVAGWIWECVYMSISDKNLVNRGFLTGPYIPIYGFGGLLVQTAFGQWSNGLLTFNTLKIYIVGALSATILEYIVSYILELAFNARWWDYSDYKFNLNGRICLVASLFWGLISVVCVQIVNPYLIKVLHNIDRDIKLVFVASVASIMILDTINTIITVINLKTKLSTIYELENLKFNESMTKLSNISKDYRDNLGKVETLYKEYNKVIADKLSKSYKFINKDELRLIRAFPKFKFKYYKYQETLSRIKGTILKRYKSGEK